MFHVFHILNNWDATLAIIRFVLTHSESVDYKLQTDRQRGKKHQFNEGVKRFCVIWGPTLPPC